MSKTNKTRLPLKWVLAGLPLGAIIGGSFVSLPDWVRQAFIAGTLIWFYAFYLLDCFYLGG